MHKIYTDKKFLFAFCGILAFSTILWSANLFKQNLFFNNYFKNIQKYNDLEEVGKYLLANQMINIKNLNDSGEGLKRLSDSLNIFIESENTYKSGQGERGSSPASIQYKNRHQQTGFIKILNFKSGSYLEFMNSLEEITDNRSLDTLILDIRDARGGQLSEVIKIANQLESREKLPMAFSTYFNGDTKPINSTGSNFFPQKAIQVLIDQDMDDVSKYLAVLLANNENAHFIGQRFDMPVTIRQWYPLTSGNYASIPVGFMTIKEQDIPDSESIEVLQKIDSSMIVRWLQRVEQ